MNRLKLVSVVWKATRMQYCRFDTAAAYGNEEWLGRALKLCGKRRRNLFVTTKLSNSNQRSGDVRLHFKNSLSRLGLKYLDLYLMHWPNPDTYLNSWKQMELLYEEGLVRAIGVCNFHQHHLEKLFKIANVVPAINQIELHPMLSQKNLADFCERNTIKVEAYSPLARMHDKLIKNKTLASIAQKHNKSVPQVILRWNYQNGHLSVPKSSNLLRLKENISIFNFTLSNNEMFSIDQLNCNFRVRYDPDNCDFNKL
ncbi:MAG: aldo/keto reductase [bacterium]